MKKDCLYRLVICTPVLSVDKYLHELAVALIALKACGLEFTHIVVGPSANEGSVLAVFEGVGSVYVAERKGTRGVFDAVDQGMNYAFENFSPTALMYINADDLLYPAVKKLFDKHVENPDAIIVGRAEWLSENGESNGFIPSWPFRKYSDLLFEIGVQPITQQSMLIPSAVWRSEGGIDLSYRYIADSALWHKVLRDGETDFIFLRVLAAGYRMRAGQLSSNRPLINLETERWKACIHARSGHSWAALSLKLAFRLLNFRIYMRRMVAGRKMRSVDAMSAGGF